MSGDFETYITSQELINEVYQLYMACKKRDRQEVSKLVRQLKERNVKFKLIVGDRTTTLHLMSFHGNLGMVKLLVEMYGNAEAKDENQRTPLHLACMQGHLDIAQYLYFECECNLQCEDKDGWKPIDLAGFHNQTDIVKYFDTYGRLPKADLQKLFQVVNQFYLLFTAHKKRDFHLVRECNSHLCVMNVKFVLKSENCSTILHLMCELGVLDRVKNLIEMYGNVEARDENWRTPLHIASANGHIDVAEYLICECGCDKEARDNKQNTPLFAACWNNQTAMVKHLVSKLGCKFDIRDVMGWTLLHLACIKGYTDIVEYLINQCGIDKEARENKFQYTPLFAACLGGQISTIKFLISKFRCEVDARDVSGRTPLHVACYSGFQEIVKYFINDCGCSAEVRDETLQTPLHWACAGGHLEIIKYLINECKCNKEARDKLNFTPLYIASRCLHSSSGSNINNEVVSYLILEHGCDPEAEALNGDSPMRLFYYCGELNLIQYCIILKKHDPRTWKCRTRPLNTKEQQDSLHCTQSSSYLYYQISTSYCMFRRWKPECSQVSCGGIWFGSTGKSQGHWNR